MAFDFNFDEVKKQLLDFMTSQNIMPYEDSFSAFRLDGEIHRFRTREDKQGEKSGAYCIHSDGWPAGFVQDWRKGIKELFKFNISGLPDEQQKYFNSEEYSKKCEEQHRKSEQKRAKKRAEQSERARIFFDTLEQAADNHPYLLRKGVKPYGIACNSANNNLAVPLRDINGRLLSIQWITPEGQKLFYTGAEMKGAFFSINIDTLKTDPAQTILLGEGYATMAKVHELTGYPVIAAMSCHRLRETAEIIHQAFPRARIIIAADNDWETAKKTGRNPGLVCAEDTIKEKFNVTPAIGFFYPDFSPREHGSDWDDFAAIHGDIHTAAVLRDEIAIQLLPSKIKRMVAKDELQTVNAQLLRDKQFDPIKWVVPGIIPSGLSIFGGGPKTGKSIFVLDVAVAIAIGGYVFGKIKVEQGDALYLALEDNERRLQERIDFINLDDTDDLFRLTLVTRIPRQHEGGIDYITWWLDEHPDARVVIIDTLQMFRRQLSGRGNVYAEDYEVISELRVIAAAYNVGIIVLHHLKKTSSREAQENALSGDWINSFSGSIGLSGSADALFMLKRDRMAKAGQLFRTGRDVEECTFELVLEGLRWDFKGEAEDILLPTWKKQILDFLSEHSTVSPMDLANGYGINIKTAQTNIRRLEREGIIRKVGYGTYGKNTDNSK